MTGVNIRRGEDLLLGYSGDKRRRQPSKEQIRRWASQGCAGFLRNRTLVVSTARGRLAQYHPADRE